jgi:hypothetical protein
MQQKQIKEIIEESKSNIRKDILKDNLVMFFTRVIEDLKNDSSKNLFGRAYELYYLINPYKALHSRKQILTFFKNKFEQGEGFQLDDEEMNYLKIFFGNIEDDFSFKNPKVIAGRFNGILNKLCDKYFPESSQVIEPLLLGRILCSVGGVERLSRLPSSTIQLIGAERALCFFRLFIHSLSSHSYHVSQIMDAVLGDSSQRVAKGSPFSSSSLVLLLTMKYLYTSPFPIFGIHPSQIPEPSQRNIKA